MDIYYKVGRKRTIRVNKISVEDFVKKGYGTKDQYYELTGKKPKVENPIEVKKPIDIKKEAGK